MATSTSDSPQPEAFPWKLVLVPFVITCALTSALLWGVVGTGEPVPPPNAARQTHEAPPPPAPRAAPAAVAPVAPRDAGSPVGVDARDARTSAAATEDASAAAQATDPGGHDPGKPPKASKATKKERGKPRRRPKPKPKPKPVDTDPNSKWKLE